MSQTFSDESLVALQRMVWNIDYLAQRLTDWRALGTLTQHVESQFEGFLRELETIEQVPTKEQIATMKSRWADCARDLDELSLRSDEFQALTRTLDGSADSTLQAWLEELMAVARMVGADFKKNTYGESFIDHCTNYQGACRKIRIRREAKINTELKQLAGLANELKLRFQ